MATFRTLSLVSLVLMWLCAFSTVDSRSLFPKKHTASPSKYHRHHFEHKNAIPHHHQLAVLRELGLGSHKAARETTPPRHFTTEKQTIKGHVKPVWGAFKPSHRLGAVEDALVGAATETSLASGVAAPPKPIDEGFGEWGPPIPTHTQKEPTSKGFFSGPSRVITSSATKTTSDDDDDDDDDGFGVWGAYKPSRHTAPAEEAAAGSTSKAIHVRPGQPPRVVEESFPGGDFGTFVSPSETERSGTDTSDGWFMSFVPYPQPETEQEDAESSSSSSSSGAFAGMFGLFRDRKRGCDDAIEDRPCKSNSDCLGCNKTFQCSSNRKCQKV
ncbi:uncharacterized protein [Diadema antillarum]|uniref:uncharacterized protein n=1 Tax=Diadema antillarum TaxID=105358 RepID=UPI003A874AFD